MSFSSADFTENTLLSLEEGNCLEAAPFGDTNLLTTTDSGAAELGLTAENALPPLPEEPIAEAEAEFTTVVAATSLAASDPLLNVGDNADNPLDGIEDTSVKAKEINAIRDLTSSSLATAVAVQNGDFSNPATFGGTLPGDGARVIVPAGITVTYDLEGANVPRLDTLRVDGTLEFVTNQDTDLIVDLFVVEEGGTLRIGTAANPIRSNVDARITFASANPNNAAIDLTRDPLQVSRGLIALPGSTTDIHGTDRADFTSLASNGARSGDTVLRLESVAGLEVGDHLVLTGTSYNENGSNADNSRFQDEELTVTSINAANNTITFEQRDIGGNGLRFDHVAPEGFGLDIYVANLTRNVTFASAQGEDTPIQERGYTLFLDQDLRLFNAGFDGLGRFDNDILVNNPVLNADGSLQAGTGTNRNGRIPVYIADTLVTGSYNDAAAIVSGNAVNGSASWSFAAATSRVTFEDNVSFDVVGTHFVTRDGDEIATFRDNIAIKATGAQTIPGADLQILNSSAPGFSRERGRFRDLAVRGFGFWFDSPYSAREVTGNIAVSTEDTGFLVYGTNDREDAELRQDRQILVAPGGLAVVPISSLPPELQSIGNGRDPSKAEHIGAEFIPAHLVPNVAGSFSGNTVYNAESGFEVRGVLRNDDGDFSEANRFGLGVEDLGGQSFTIDDFTIFGVREFGAQPGLYAAQVTVRDSLILGNLDNPIARKGGTFSGGPIGHGITAEQNSRGIILIDNHIEGFEVGIELHGTNTNSLQLADELDPTDLLGGAQVIGATLANNTYNFGAADGRSGTGGSFGRIVDNGPFNPLIQISGNLNIDIPQGNVAPEAIFGVTPINDLSARFDASGSIDPDYGVVTQIQIEISDPNETVDTVDNDNPIASYRWDFDSDGEIDAFGREVDFTYDAPGTYTATLTVIDNQGATSTETLEVTVGSGGPVIPPADPTPTPDPAPEEPSPTPTEPGLTSVGLSVDHLGFFDQPLGTERESTFTLNSIPSTAVLSFTAFNVDTLSELELFVNDQQLELPVEILGFDPAGAPGTIEIDASLLLLGQNTIKAVFADNNGGTDNGFRLADVALAVGGAAPSPPPEDPEFTSLALSSTHLGFFNEPFVGTERISTFDLESIPGTAVLSFTAFNVDSLNELELFINDQLLELPEEILGFDSDGAPVTIEIDASLLLSGQNTIKAVFADNNGGTDNGFRLADVALAVGGAAPSPPPEDPEFTSLALSSTHLGFFNEPFVGTERISTFDLESIPGTAVLSFTAFNVDSLNELELFINDQLLELPEEILGFDSDGAPVTIEIDASLLLSGQNTIKAVFADNNGGTDNGFRLADLALAVA